MVKKNEDLEHLRILSIFHYVVAGLAAVFACIPLIHMVLGLAIVFDVGNISSRDEAPALLGWFLLLFAGGVILCGWGFAFCLFLAGRSLAQTTRYTFCLVMAGVACMFMPFGTVLGVFTIIVLMRDSVKELFRA